MLLAIKLDKNHSGDLTDLACDADRRKLNAQGITLSGFRAMGVRTKANKISNNDQLVPYESASPSIMCFQVSSRGQSRAKATIMIDTSEWSYEVTVAPEERKRALVAEVEISVIPAKKAKA